MKENCAFHIRLAAQELSEIADRISYTVDCAIDDYRKELLTAETCLEDIRYWLKLKINGERLDQEIAQ